MIQVTQAISPHVECTILINPRYIVLAEPSIPGTDGGCGSVSVISFQSGDNVKQLYIKESLERIRELILDYEFGVWEPIEDDHNDDDEDWWRK